MAFGNKLSAIALSLLMGSTVSVKADTADLLIGLGAGVIGKTLLDQSAKQPQ
ncbi:hypothetical protein [Flexibacterium corallicola]|uniref:hypothetical protein n=1 Tax=Flexibacterium corallicola TaxID=3037259 RepID=UPI00286F8622|nr:hypothetical protein [Pseudovibrio sp. M1P-2-3]